jgi:hypothetical protein
MVLLEVRVTRSSRLGFSPKVHVFARTGSVDIKRAAHFTERFCVAKIRAKRVLEHDHIAGEKRIMNAQRRMRFMAKNNRTSGGGSNAAVVAIVVIFLIIVAAAIFFGGQFVGGGSGSKKVDVNVKAPAVPGKSP